MTDHVYGHRQDCRIVCTKSTDKRCFNDNDIQVSVVEPKKKRLAAGRLGNVRYQVLRSFLRPSSILSGGRQTDVVNPPKLYAEMNAAIGDEDAWKETRSCLDVR